MLHRPDNEGLIVITQTAHAWISGQLARALPGTFTEERAMREALRSALPVTLQIDLFSAKGMD